MWKSLMMCFVLKVYLNVEEFGRFVLDQYEGAATPQNLSIVHDALQSAELKVSSATSIRQRGKLGWTAFLKMQATYTGEWAAVIQLHTTSHPDLLL